MNVKELAQKCHEVNKAYCEFIGDNSQKSWDEAEGWQKNSAINGVTAFLADPTMKPEDQHSAWSQAKLDEGWVYGEVKDAEAKTHPCLVPYEELSLEQRTKDFLFQTTIKLFMNQVTL